MIFKNTDALSDFTGDDRDEDFLPKILSNIF